MGGLSSAEAFRCDKSGEGENIPTDRKQQWGAIQRAGSEILRVQPESADWDEPELLSQHVPGPWSEVQNFSAYFALRQMSVTWRPALVDVKIQG